MRSTVGSRPVASSARRARDRARLAYSFGRAVTERRRFVRPTVRTRAFAGRTARYTMVGAICAVLNNILIIGGGFLGAGYVAMSLVAFALTTPLGYLLNTRFTFEKPPSIGGLLRFASAAATVFPVFLVLMAIFCSGLGMPVAIATPLCTIILYFYNYALAHWAILYRRRLP